MVKNQCLLEIMKSRDCTFKRDWFEFLTLRDRSSRANFIVSRTYYKYNWLS